MLPDSGSTVVLGDEKDVLILIVMEDAPRLRRAGINSTWSWVLILIVMEDAPRPVIKTRLGRCR